MNGTLCKSNKRRTTEVDYVPLGLGKTALKFSRDDQGRRPLDFVRAVVIVKARHVNFLYFLDTGKESK